MKVGSFVRGTALALVVYASGFTGTPANAQIDDLYRASARGDLPAVKALLNAHADPNKGLKGAHAGTPLAAASFGDHLEVVEALLAAGADVNAGDGGDPPLVLASDYGHLRVVQSLLAAGADVDAKGVVTPLIAASRNG